MISMRDVSFEDCQFVGSNSTNTGSATFGLHLGSYPQDGVGEIENVRISWLRIVLSVISLALVLSMLC